MVPEKEKPPIDECLAAESKQGSDDANGLPSRLSRYSKAHHRALLMADYAREQGQVKLATNLRSCGHYLLFRHYYTVEKMRLHAAKFCNKHLLCPLCAIRRGAKQVQAYLARLQVIRAADPGLKLSLVTLTVKDGAELGERFRHLRQAFRAMQQARRNHLKGRGPYVEMACFDGAVGSYEFKRGKNSGEWHPHLHMVVLHRHSISQKQLSADWLKYTGDSFIVDVTPFNEGQDPVEGFLEVFKYALKFSDMPLEDNWQGFKTLTSKRLVFSFGLFWGVEVPEELTEEDLENEPFVDLLFRFSKGSGYSFLPMKKESNIKPFVKGEVVMLASRKAS
jgi:hypothetical protein